MTPLPRHQCLIHRRTSSRQDSILAAVIRQKLRQNYRCLYLNSAPMVTSMRAALEAAGVDVLAETVQTKLHLTSDRSHLIDGKFDVDRMITALEIGIEQALADGFDGFWATGDMSWEFGPERDFSRLMEYEWRLEETFRRYPQLSGICQYDAETLPDHVIREGLISHPTLYLNETLSILNPQYLPHEQSAFAAARSIPIKRN